MKFKVQYEIGREIPSNLKRFNKEQLNTIISLKNEDGFMLLQQLLQADLNDISEKQDEFIIILNGTVPYEYNLGMMKGKKEKILEYANIIELAEAELKRRKNKEDTKQLTQLKRQAMR